MPQLNSFADVLTDLERLLAAADANAQLLPGLDVSKAPLQQVIADLRSLAVRRDTLNADKQVLTADLQLALQSGREIGSQFRGFIRSHLGMRNEKLTEFRVLPRRLGTRAKRGSGAKVPGVKPTPAPEPSPPSGAIAANAANPVGPIAVGGALARQDSEGGANGQE